MSPDAPHVLLVSGTTGRQSVTVSVLADLAARLNALGLSTDLLDLAGEPLPVFNPETTTRTAEHAALKARVDRAAVLVLGTPDYHGSMSGALKNFLDHFWSEFAGRLFVPIVVSHEKGLTVLDQMRTVARQCYAWSLPYGISVAAKGEVLEGRVAADGLRDRLAMAAADIRVYGALLDQQRRADLAGSSPGFLARHRT